jgi:hypothetical protein
MQQRCDDKILQNEEEEIGLKKIEGLEPQTDLCEFLDFLITGPLTLSFKLRFLIERRAACSSCLLFLSVSASFQRQLQLSFCRSFAYLFHTCPRSLRKLSNITLFTCRSQLTLFSHLISTAVILLSPNVCRQFFYRVSG